MRWPALPLHVCLPLILATVACSSDAELRPFTSDGCSLFPDASLINASDWCSCCYEHDIAYWKGGTYEEREAADRELQRCVARKSGDETLANMMYDGVRFGGSPYFYNWYRWGYGWGYDRKYQEMTAEETRNADQLLATSLRDNPPTVCD